MTNEEISKLSNHDLTKAILEKLRFYVKEKQYDQDAVVVFGDEFNDGFVGDYLVDYCNNWNDLMPLIVKYCLGIEPSYDYWRAFYWDEGFQHQVILKSPQRALAECLLQVLIAKGE